jgi:hypothetical protein
VKTIGQGQVSPGVRDKSKSVSCGHFAKESELVKIRRGASGTVSEDNRPGTRSQGVSTTVSKDNRPGTVSRG